MCIKLLTFDTIYNVMTEDNKLKWTKGMASPNPLGRKLEVNTERAKVRRVLKYYTVTQIKKLLSRQDAKYQLDFYLQVLPYELARQTPKSELDALSDEQVNKIYTDLEQVVTAQIKAN